MDVHAAPLTLPLTDLRRTDTDRVGGKNASLGELLGELSAAGIRVPDGFATTADAYWALLDANDLRPTVADQLDRLDAGAELAEVGAAIRGAILAAEVPDEVRAAIVHAYEELGATSGRDRPEVAVRSSATAEDLPEASFAGQQETYLNIRGVGSLVEAWRRCCASLFTDRAISYRRHQGFDGLDLALSVGVQLMVRSDRGCAGVLFSIDPETGFRDTVLVNGAWGLGEAVVSGQVDPDEYVVFRPLLDDPDLRPVISAVRGAKARKVVAVEDPGEDEAPVRTVETTPAERDALVLSEDEVLQLARWAVAIEQHYGTAMDVEWAKDGDTDELFVVQARPETVQARRGASSLRRFRLREEGEVLVEGIAVGEAIAAGPVCRLDSAADIDRFVDGAVLVTTITDPDWEPVMKRAAAIVTDHGGRTSHAAIVSRELGLSAVVGTGDATEVLEEGREVTVSCAEGDRGHVYDGRLDFDDEELDLSAVPETRTKVMLNVASPAAAFRWWRLPADGVGLARIEFVVNNHVKAHPMALLHPEQVDDPEVRDRLDRITRGYDDGAAYFVDRLAQGVARIAASRWPDPVVVRTSDFKTNEYARLVGGQPFEPHEENPMIGWRGASRYYSEGYREAFGLECRALARVRDEMGLTNVVVMIPFCRTLEEADRVLATMAEHGLERGRNGLLVYVMAEIPSNVLLAADFAERFDGFSVGSNDLTQLTLGVDRDSEALRHLFDERNPAVTRSIERLVADAHEADTPVGLCGQRPSDDPDFARFLVETGIDSISVVPDSFLRVKEHVAEAERALAPPAQD